MIQKVQSLSREVKFEDSGKNFVAGVTFFDRRYHR